MNVSATNTISIAGTAQAKYLVDCKRRQDERAEESLLRQGLATGACWALLRLDISFITHLKKCNTLAMKVKFDVCDALKNSMVSSGAIECLASGNTR
ncbi:hypothetical protein SBP02_08490 [Pseudomonas benzenivorans]|uniref:Uncharacterized protein n=1 Tax=Pseudomonas benzenivorans TaxID=556533 RepID=A0ABZ0PZX5_9PSED|nr:hypothetical protein [Pseudomonas benzenivorans]WPC06768.1 hypothetical protein SBP02_08490 [Pseudomonas benzenivorans]